ncbi:2-C-methyl-D-erythritol 4-phosphate cytidylyltransferase, partial [Candidatus Omnitrophota bacterium]
MAKKTEVVVVAAGKGLRLKKNIPKAFISLNNRPLVYYCLKTFQKHPKISSIVLVVEKSQLARARSIVKRFKLSKVSRIVAGGRQRKDSVANGLKNVSKTASNVLIHDAARPFVTSALVNSIIKALAKYRFVVPGIPAQDTLKSVDKKGIVKSTLVRDSVFQ